MKFQSLNRLGNLQVHTETGTGERRRTGSVGDKVAQEFAKASTPAEVAQVAARHGIEEREIVTRAGDAPNFGQFRMVLGNRVRGVLRRQKDKGMSRQQAAYPGRTGTVRTPKGKGRPGRSAGR